MDPVNRASTRVGWRSRAWGTATLTLSLPPVGGVTIQGRRGKPLVAESIGERET